MKRHNQQGFAAWIVIGILAIVGALGGLVATKKVNLGQVLSPQSKIAADKTNNVLFAAVRAAQVEEENAWHKGTQPALNVTDASGKTLHARIGAVEVKVYTLIKLVDDAVAKLPTGGTLSIADLGFVKSLGAAVSELLDLLRPVIGTTAGALLDNVQAKAAQFSAQVQAVKQ